MNTKVNTEINTNITIDKIKVVKHLIDVNMNKVLNLELEFNPTSNLFSSFKKQYTNVIEELFKLLEELINRLENENNLYLETVMNLINQKSIK